MRDWIISFLVSKIGSYVVVAINAGLALLIAKFATYCPDLANQISEPALATFIWGALMSIINYLTTHWCTKDAKSIQTALVKLGANLNIDGWIGDKTVQAFEAKTGVRIEHAIQLPK